MLQGCRDPCVAPSGRMACNWACRWCGGCGTDIACVALPMERREAAQWLVNSKEVTQQAFRIWQQWCRTATIVDGRLEQPRLLLWHRCLQCMWVGVVWSQPWSCCTCPLTSSGAHAMCLVGKAPVQKPPSRLAAALAAGPPVPVASAGGVCMRQWQRRAVIAIVCRWLKCAA